MSNREKHNPSTHYKKINLGSNTYVKQQQRKKKRPRKIHIIQRPLCIQSDTFLSEGKGDRYIYIF